jgi:hypothetical protein
MAETRILRGAVRDEVRHTILREAEARYRNELLDDEERQLLLDRIKRLRRGKYSDARAGVSSTGEPAPFSERRIGWEKVRAYRRRRSTRN